MMTAAIFFAPRQRRGAPRESMEVLRAQLELSVCDQRGAGTSDAVTARFGRAGDAGDTTWLYRPGPNFERGGRNRYDLLLDHVRSLADVTQLVVEKTGDDDLCLRELQLLINGRPIFWRILDGGLWLRGGSLSGNTLSTSGAELRANAAWQAYAWSLPEWIATTGAAVSREEVADRLTSSVASAMHGLGYRWAIPPAGGMVVRRKDDVTLHASAGLLRPMAHVLTTDVALEFDVQVCTARRANPRLVNVALHVVRPWYAVAYGRNQAANDAQTLNDLAARLTKMRPLVLPGELCPRIDAQGNLGY